MAITNQDRVGKAMDLLRDGLRPFAERELKSKYGDQWPTEVKAAFPGGQSVKAKAVRCMMSRPCSRRWTNCGTVLWVGEATCRLP